MASSYADSWGLYSSGYVYLWSGSSASLTITDNNAKTLYEKKGIALLVHSPQTENNQTTSITAFFSSQQAGL